MQRPRDANESKRVSPAVWAVLAAVVLFAIGLRIRQAWMLRHPVLAELKLRGKTFVVEVADSNAKREKGLGDRDVLAPDHGMYFPFSDARYWVFWMKGMRFPIDIVWIRDGRVVDITPNVPVDSGFPLKTYSPVEPADAVLEIRAGAAGTVGVAQGDGVLLTAR